MATFLKDVLYPGSYSVSDGKGGRRKVSYSRDEVRFLERRMRDMLAAGLSIPLAAEHQEQAKPLTEEERKAEWVKKLTMGWAAESELAPEGFLTAKVEVPDAKDAERMPAVRFVSPEIVHDFIDGTGRKWPGPSITHLAVTPRPVQHNQKPFQPVQMSVVRLSLTDYVALSEGPHVLDESTSESDAKPSETPKGDNGLKDVLAALREDGYALPEDTDDENFIERLHTAALTKKATLDQLLTDDDKSKPVDGEPEPAPGGGPVMMSLCGHKIAVQRKAKKKADTPATQLSLEGDNPFAKRLLTKERQDIQKRIQSLFASGRITKPIADKLTQQAGTVRLSLDAGGELAGNSVLAKVEAYEELHEGAAFPTEAALSGATAFEYPAGVWGAPTEPLAVETAVNDFFGMLPGSRQKAK